MTNKDSDKAISELVAATDDFVFFEEQLETCGVDVGKEDPQATPNETEVQASLVELEILLDLMVISHMNRLLLILTFVIASSAFSEKNKVLTSSSSMVRIPDKRQS